MEEVIATDWTQYWLALSALLIVVLPALISSLKKAAPFLDGPTAFWVNMLLPIFAGLLGYITTSDPTVFAAGVGAGFATQGTYQLSRRVGLSEGGKVREERKRGFR